MDLNSNKADSTPIFQSQQWTNKDETSNRITLEHIFRDLDTLETFQNDGAGYDDIEEQVDPNNSHFGPGSKSPTNDAPIVKPGLVRETAVKWVRATRPFNPYDDLAQKTNLEKRHSGASICEHSEAKRCPKKSENACSQTCPMVEATQQPR